MLIKNALIAIATLAVSTSSLLAQGPPGGPPGGGPHEGGPPEGGHPIIKALDADENHELSAAEIKNATKALLALDKNGDGMLNEEDLGRMGPPPGGEHGGGRGGPPGGGPPGGGHGGDTEPMEVTLTEVSRPAILPAD